MVTGTEREVIEAIRIKDTGIVSQEPNQSSRSLLQCYRRGLLSQRELIVSTPSLSSFLREHGLKYKGFLAPLYTRFSPIEGIFLRRSLKNRSHVIYAVDPKIMEEQLPRLRNFIVELEARKYPPRTTEEQKRFRQQLFTVKNPDGTSQPIPEEDGYRQIFEQAIRGFSSRGFTAVDSEDLALAVIEKLKPYIEGERHEFANFNHFLNYMRSAIKNHAINEFKKRARKPKNVSIEEHLLELTSSITEERSITPAQIEELLAQLTSRQQQVVRLKLQGYTDQQISGILQISSVGVRVAMTRVLDRLHPNRKKAQTYKGSMDTDTLVEAYKIFRDNFLASNGRLPTSYAINRATQKGMFPRTTVAMKLRFGGRTWADVQSILEGLIKQRSL